MDEQYKETELIRGKLYRYDPDFDAYFRVTESEHVISKYSWIFISVCMLAVIAYVEFLR